MPGSRNMYNCNSDPKEWSSRLSPAPGPRLAASCAMHYNHRARTLSEDPTSKDMQVPWRQHPCQLKSMDDEIIAQATSQASSSPRDIADELDDSHHNILSSCRTARDMR